MKVPEIDLDDEGLVSGNVNVDAAEGSNNRSKRRRVRSDATSKSKTKARSKGWWYSVDRWFEARVKEWGSDFNSSKWKELSTDSF